jgi:S1-C subfamily serine protease
MLDPNRAGIDGDSPLKILKTFWARQNDGAWHIAAMHGVDLGGNESVENFYAVRDELVLTQAPSIGTVRFFMGESIVPVVATVQGENILRCIGTGFFISCSGLLITAAHVIIDPFESKYAEVSGLDV